MSSQTSLSITATPLYSVFDVVAQEYGPPFLSKSDATALRVFRNMISKEHILGTDYKLFRLGHFYAETGDITAGLEEVHCAVDIEKMKEVFAGAKEVTNG